MVKTAHAATTQMLAATIKMRIIFFPRRRGAAGGDPLVKGGPDARVTCGLATGALPPFCLKTL
jgi:hypothetical protein